MHSSEMKPSDSTENQATMHKDPITMTTEVRSEVKVTDGLSGQQDVRTHLKGDELRWHRLRCQHITAINATRTVTELHAEKSRCSRLSAEDAAEHRSASPRIHDLQQFVCSEENRE